VLFWGMSSAQVLAFYIIAFGVIAGFIWGFSHTVAKYRRGQPSPVQLDLWAGVRRMFSDLLSHRTVRRRDPVAGVAHMAIFYGFAVLFIGTSIITLQHDILEPLFGIVFWHGIFFLIFSLLLDIAGALVFFGIITLMARRAFFNLPKLNYLRDYAGETELRGAARRWQREDWIFLIALLLIIVTGFLQEGTRHALEHPIWGRWEPVGAALGTLLSHMGLSGQNAAALRCANWWLHGCAALTFIVAVPWYKAKHIIAATGALAGRNPQVLRRLPALLPDAVQSGVSHVHDFSWKDMLDFDACTKCGRCHEACPARTAGYPLSPRDLILDLRLHNDQAQGRKVSTPALVGGIISEETLWSCRMCGACVEICPVGIEHPIKIVQMRRALIEQDRIAPLLKTVLSTIAVSGNSFGEPARARGTWSSDLEFRIKDIRHEAAQFLWFVGDQASFDPRNQKVTRTVARLFKAAGVDFGLLYEGEKTAGNDVRRVGEEGLFESLVEHNMAQMSQAREFHRIVTTDPHTLNTLRNEYPEYGQIRPVSHYTELLCELLESGALKVIRPLGLRVTYHDPCHLGRLNKVYDAPRRLLELTGCTLIEMPRNRHNSFCCGAGGGRIWMPDNAGTQKPSEIRIREAAQLYSIDVFVTSCPKDLTMFEDARKTAGAEKAFVVEDIADLVAQAIGLEQMTLRDLPDLTERITAAIADKVALAVAEKIDVLMRSRMLLTSPDLPAVRNSEAAAQTSAGPVADAIPAPAPAPAPADRVRQWRVQAVPAAQLPDYGKPEKTGLRILVLVKHVGRLGNEFLFSGDAKHILPEYFEYQLNEWDDTALEQALRIVELSGSGEVIVATVGPPAAEETLRKSLAKGAHRAVRVWDDALQDADVITVARMLAGVAVQEQPDLILAGAQSADFANGATGPAIAKMLGLPCAALVVATDWDGGAVIHVTRELEGGLQHKIHMQVPALITMQTGANTPRYASMRMIKQARDKPLIQVSASADVNACAAASLVRMTLPPATRARMLEGSPADVAQEIMQVIRSRTGGQK